MAPPPHTWHGSPAQFPSLHARRKTPSPLPLLPWEVYLWSWVWNQFFPPYFLANWTFWAHLQPHRTHLSPSSHIYPCPALSARTLRELRDKHNFTSGWFYFLFILNVWSWYNSHVCTVGQYSAARPPKNSEVSSHAFKSLAAHRSRWNDRDLHTLWDLLWSVLIQLFIHLATLATELWASVFSKVPCGGWFLRSFLGQLCPKVIIHSRTCPGHLEKTREG